MRTRHLLLRNGNPFYMHGANYPWMVVDGKSNYGSDFGLNVRGEHRGVSKHRKQVEQDFAAMAALGFNTLRWFVFTDGRGGIRYNDKLMPVALAERCIDDLRAAADIATEYGVGIIFVLFDFLILYDIHPHHPELKAHLMRTEEGRAYLLENILTPLFMELGNHPGILSWEVMNEPDWVIEELDRNRKEVSVPLALDAFKKFVANTSALVRRHTKSYVTVGGGRIKFATVWDDDLCDLDFLQVHTYNDFLREPYDTTLFGRDCASLGLRRPLLIGEFSTHARAMRPSGAADRTTPIEVREYLDFAKSKGYAGALYWSFNDVDGCHSEDPALLADWALRRLVT